MSSAGNGDAGKGNDLLAVINRLMAAYGPYVLSLVMVLVLYQWMLAPILAARQLDWQKMELLMDRFREQATIQSESARTLERASILIDAAVRKLGETK